MTVSTTSVTAIGLGNGSTTDFTFSYTIPSADELTITYVTAAGVETDITSQCTITLNEVADGALWAVGGTVTYNPSGTPIASGTYIVIARALEETQETDFTNQDSTAGEVTEMTFDEVVMLVQQLQEAINRCYKIDQTDRSGLTVTLPSILASARASQLFGWDSSGIPTPVALPAGSVSISSAMSPVVGAATLALARTAMGVIGDPTTTEGDLIYRTSGALARLALGAANTLLTSNGTDPAYSTLTALLDAAFGSAQGSILYRGAAAWDDLGPGTSGQVLVTMGAAANPQWSSTGSVVPTGAILSFSGLAANLPTGFLLCYGQAVSRTTYSTLLGVLTSTATVTISIASPGVVTWTGHGYVGGEQVSFETTGSLPTGLAVGTSVYVLAAGLTADTFRVAATQGGTAINTTGSQSGVHTGRQNPYGCGNGSTTFNLPDLRGRLIAGQDNMGGSSANRLTSAASGIYAQAEGSVGGAETVTLSAAQSGLPAHTHTYATTLPAGGEVDSGSVYSNVAAGSAGTTGSTGGTAASTAHNNAQPTMVMEYIIKY